MHWVEPSVLTGLRGCNRIAKGDRDWASVILIAAGSLLGLAIQGGFSWLCTLGVVARQEQEFAKIGNGKTSTADTGPSFEIAKNVIVPQFRPLNRATLPKPEPRVVPEPVGELDAVQVKSLFRKLNKERLLGRAYTSKEMDEIPIPVRRQMCLSVISERTTQIVG